MNKRKLITIAAILISSLSVIAQIPNAGFETWTTVNNRPVPDGWYTTNSMIDSTAAYFPATKSSDHFPDAIGNYSMRIESNPALTGAPSWGVVMTTRLDGTDRPLFPLTGHPNSLCGYFKYLPANDSLHIYVALFKNGIEIASGSYFNSNTVSSWASFQIPFSTYTEADSARITISSCTIDRNMIAQSHSVLFIDNLSFDTPVSVENKPVVTLNAINLALTGNNTLNYQLPTAATVSATIYDINGRLVFSSLSRKHSAGSHSMPIALAHSSSGVYLLKFKANDVSVSKHFIVMK